MLMSGRNIICFLLLLASVNCLSNSKIDELGHDLSINRGEILERYESVRQTLFKEGLISSEIFNSLLSSNMSERGLIYLGEHVYISRDDSMQDILNTLTNMAKKENDIATLVLSFINIYYFNDCDVGVRLLKEAMKMKMVVAYTFFGRLYEFGSCGLDKSYDVATEWYEKASKLGDPEAMYRLSILSFTGKYKKNGDWFSLLLKSAKRGLPSAQELLAKVYLSKGIKYYEESFAWYLIAYIQGEDVLDDIYAFKRYKINMDSEKIKNIINSHGSYRYYIFEYADVFHGKLRGN